MTDRPPRLILFSRLPRAGEAKTRLIPALGAKGAARLQERMARRLAGRMRQLAARLPLELELCYTGGDEAQARAWLGQGFVLREQIQGHLGERMAEALERALAQGAPRAVLVGSDLPGLGAPLLARAFAALESSPWCWVPAPTAATIWWARAAPRRGCWTIPIGSIWPEFWAGPRLWAWSMPCCPPTRPGHPGRPGPLAGPRSPGQGLDRPNSLTTRPATSSMGRLVTSTSLMPLSMS